LDFVFSPEQLALRDTARRVFEAESSPARLRDLWNGAERDQRVWKTMAEVGLLGVTIPERFGGMGGDAVDLVLVLEEAGRAALPEPLLEAAAIVAPLLVEAGTPEQQETWLPRLASGDALVTVAVPHALDADRADAVLLEADGTLHLVPRDRVDVRPLDSIDRARSIFGINAETGADTAFAAPASLQTRGAVAVAAALNGVCMRLLELSVEHAKTRRQFGKPIGSFQAVKHMLAAMHVLLEQARPAAWYASYAIARGLPDAAFAASVAKVAALQAHEVIGRDALQVHGGIGFTWEHDLHLWLNRGLALAPLFGTGAEHRARLAASLPEEGDPDA